MTSTKERQHRLILHINFVTANIDYQNSNLIHATRKKVALVGLKGVGNKCEVRFLSIFKYIQVSFQIFVVRTIVVEF